MKNCLLMLGFMFAAAFANAQKIDHFFNQKGVAELAFCAHPTNTYVRGTYTVYNDCVIVEIFYDGGIRTKLRINWNDQYFSGIQVLDDTDFFPPFKAIGDIISSSLRANDPNLPNNETVQGLENMLNRSLENWNGRDWTLLLINLDYFSS